MKFNFLIFLFSITGYAFYAYITGVSSEKSGVMGLRWWDRNRNFGNFRAYVGTTAYQMDEDIKKDVNTVFEGIYFKMKLHKCR